jgi:hypothetical protein
MSNGNNPQTVMTVSIRARCCDGWTLVLCGAAQYLVRRLLAAVAVCCLASASSAQTLSAHVEVSVSATNFTYGIFNDEAQTNTLSLSALYVELNAPIQAILSPPEWTYDTDGISYVSWMCTNGSPPFTSEIPPGASLGGFVLQSAVLSTDSFTCEILSIDTAATNIGPVFSGAVTAPSTPSVAPSLELSQSAGVFQLSLMGVPYYPYIIQSSTNLTDWVTFATNVAPAVFAVPAAKSAPATFYQAAFPTTQD